MDRPDLRKLFEATRPGAGDPDAKVRVLVALTTAGASEACLDQLAKLGLETHKVVGNTIMGAIAADRLAALSDDPNVREVETAKTLRPHDDS